MWAAPSMSPTFSGQPSPTGKLPFLSHRASQPPPNTKNQRHCQVGNPHKIMDPKFRKHSLFHHTQHQGCTAGWKSWGGKGNKLPHLMAWKKLYFEHIFTIRWLYLCIQMSWTQYICDTLFSEYRQQVTVSPHFCLSVFVCLSQKGNKRSFWISGKFS